MMENKDQPLHASTSEAITNNVRVEVESQYAPDRSQPFEHEWFFIYTVRISNEGDDNIQLLAEDVDRHHARHLPDGERGRRPLRRGDRALRAPRAVHRPLAIISFER